MPIPNPSTFLLETPLYERFEIGDDDLDLWSILQIEFFTAAVDSYCVGCTADSVLRGDAELPDISNNPTHRRPVSNEQRLIRDFGHATVLLPSGNWSRTDLRKYARIDRSIRNDLFCTRCMGRGLTTLALVEDGHLIKIGQYPSLADLGQANLKRYRKVLDEARMSDLNRGIGLASHGVGVGSFVYLRRVFEHLVAEAASDAREADALDEQAFEAGRMSERIKLLQDFLPPFLVEHKDLYATLSDGVHNLSEEECLGLFDAIRIGIEVILDQRLEEAERAKKTAEARRALQAMRDRGDAT